MRTQTVLNQDFTIQVLRNLARVKACFISFSTATGDDKNEPLTNEFYLPPSSWVDGADTGLEYFMTLGGKKITTFPSLSLCRGLEHLNAALGLLRDPATTPRALPRILSASADLPLGEARQNRRGPLGVRPPSVCQHLGFFKHLKNSARFWPEPPTNGLFVV